MSKKTRGEWLRWFWQCPNMTRFFLQSVFPMGSHQWKKYPSVWKKFKLPWPPPPPVFWTLWGFFKNHILDTLKFLKMFGFWSSFQIFHGQRPNQWKKVPQNVWILVIFSQCSWKTSKLMEKSSSKCLDFGHPLAFFVENVQTNGIKFLKMFGIWSSPLPLSEKIPNSGRVFFYWVRPCLIVRP